MGEIPSYPQGGRLLKRAHFYHKIKLDTFVKIRNICLSKDFIKRRKMQGTKSERIFSIHIINKGLAEYKQISPINA